MIKPLPLLCHNKNVYRGPYIPMRKGLKGVVTVDGMVGVDIVHIYGVRQVGDSVLIAELQVGVVSTIFNPVEFAFLRAFRIKSAGSPVDVWVH